jgi:hypothetical protein
LKGSSDGCMSRSPIDFQPQTPSISPLAVRAHCKLIDVCDQLGASGRLRVYIFNARVFHRADMEAYFHAFRARDPFDFIVHRLRQSPSKHLKLHQPAKRAFDYGKRASFFIKKLYEVRPELAS